MKLINTRKFTWIICIIGCLLALVSIFFLPSTIPVHFANGRADNYGRKIQIFLFPILQVLITFLTGREKVKYFLTHSKTFLTDIQFNWMIDGVLLLVMFAEIWVIYASFAQKYYLNNYQFLELLQFYMEHFYIAVKEQRLLPSGLFYFTTREVRTLKIKKVDDKPMVIHTKQKAKIHAHEPNQYQQRIRYDIFPSACRGISQSCFLRLGVRIRWHGSSGE